VERAVHYATSAAKSGRGEEARELLEISRGRVRALDLAGMGATIAQLEADIQSAASVVPLQ
jgi:hypothetical protein